MEPSPDPRSRILLSSLNRPGLPVRLHSLQVLCEIFFPGYPEFLFNFLYGRHVAVLTTFLSIDELEDTDELSLGVSGEDSDGFPNSFLYVSYE
jgi:hypothetical protein